MKKIFPFLCIIPMLFSGCYKENICYVEINNTSFGEVGGTYAKIYIAFAYTGNANNCPTISEYGVYLSETNTEPTSKDDIVKMQNDWYRPDEVELDIKGLRGNTTYYARSFARNAAGVIEGEVVSFTTTGTIGVTTTYATNITNSSAQLNGRITLVGDYADLRQRGFVISTASSPTLENNKGEWHESGSTGSYYCSVNGLSPKSQYYFRAYAVVGSETIYGDVLSFTTTAPAGYHVLSDFLGTYSCRAYNRNKSAYEEWNGVTIKEESLNWSNGIIIESMLFGAPHTYIHALGQWDENKQCIRLYSGWAFYTRTFYFNNDPSTYYYARFYPVYATSTNVTEIYTGSGYNGCGEAWLSFKNDGKLYLGPAESPGTSGCYANGMRFAYFKSATDAFSGYWATFTEVTYTKTSSSYAPDHNRTSTQSITSDTEASSHTLPQDNVPTFRLRSNE